MYEIMKLILAHLEHVSPDWLRQAGFGNYSPPLCWAAQYGAIRFIHHLLAKGFDINESNRQGLTPLHVSAQWHQEEAALLLLDQKSDNLHVQDNDGRSAFHHDAMSGGYKIAKRLLLDERLEFNSQDNDGNTPL
jgi:ankyrin repeat protein